MVEEVEDVEVGLRDEADETAWENVDEQLIY